MPVAPMPIPELAEAAPPRKRFTREEVERLTDSGVFAGQRFELIDGDLIDKMGQNGPHALAIRLLLKWLSRLLDGDLISSQLPLRLSGKDGEYSLPEPDFAILRKPMLEARHPRADEILLVIEVSDTSVTFDRTRKAALYAGAGIPEYWVLDLSHRVLLVHTLVQTGPSGKDYRQVQMYSSEESVSFPGRPESIRVSDLLPPA